MTDSRIRVAFVSEETGMGGGETSLINTVSALKRTTRAIPIIAGPGGWLETRCAEIGVEYVRIPMGRFALRMGLFPSVSLRTARALLHLVRTRQIDVLHAESAVPLVYCAIVCSLTRARCVATCHGFWPLRRRMSRLVVQFLCSRIYPVSEPVALDIERCLPRDRPPIVRLPLSVSAIFSEPGETKAEARAQLGIGEHLHVIVHIGRFQRVKGQDVLVAAMKRLVAVHGDRVRLFLIGGVEVNAESDAVQFHREVCSQVEESGLGTQVLFVGRKTEDEVARYIRAADVCVSPSRYESFGMGNVEAMVVGTPVVSTSVGASAQLVSNGVNGYLVPPENSALLAEALDHVLTNRDEAERMARRAQEGAMARFGPDVRARKLIDEYDGLLRRRMD